MYLLWVFHRSKMTLMVRDFNHFTVFSYKGSEVLHDLRMLSLLRDSIRLV